MRPSHLLHPLLGDWPVDSPARWLGLVNRPQTQAEEEAIKLSIERSRPFGSEPWVKTTAKTLDLGYTLRPRGRPVGWRKPGGRD